MAYFAHMRRIADLAGPVALGLTLVSVLVGCVDPLISDEFGHSARILPPDSTVPPIEDNAGLAARIRDGDGLDVTDPIPRRRGFADGREVFFWDFGTVLTEAIPFYFLERCDDAGNPLRGADAPPVPDHPPIANTAPGDADYSPFWRIHPVCVTERWAGERFPDLAALDDGVTIGLVSAPTPTALWVNCPLVLAEARLEVGGEVEPVAPTDTAYYAGHALRRYSFAYGTLPTDELGVTSIALTPAAVFSLRRGRDSDPVQVVFEESKTIPSGAGAMMPNPAYRDLLVFWDVVIADGADLAQLTSEGSLFSTDASGDRVPNDAVVVSASETDRRVNWPQQTMEGLPL